jgi:hypothetical protein
MLFCMFYQIVINMHAAILYQNAAENKLKTDYGT